jgi:hypothetical protein
MRAHLESAMFLLAGALAVYGAQAVLDARHGAAQSIPSSPRAVAAESGKGCACEPAPTILYDRADAATDASGRCAAITLDIRRFKTITIHGHTGTVQVSYGGVAGWQTIEPERSGSVIHFETHLGSQLRLASTVDNGGQCKRMAVTVAGYL